MGQEEFRRLLQFFKVLGNESRLKIVGMLSNEERSVGELAELLDLKEPTVSHHLAALKNLDLVTVRAEGNNRIYALDARQLERMNRELFTPQNMASLIPEAEDADAYDQKVLQAFVIDGRLTAIPRKYKKVQAILRWLVEQFEFDREYTEREVNDIILPIHPDFASLRRFMVEEGLMARENGIYWRIEEE